MPPVTKTLMPALTQPRSDVETEVAPHFPAEQTAERLLRLVLMISYREANDSISEDESPTLRHPFTTPTVAGMPPSARTMASQSMAAFLFSGQGSPREMIVDSRATTGRPSFTAARISGCQLYLSAPAGLDNRVTQFIGSDQGQRLSGGGAIHRESDADVAGMISSVQRIRYASPQRVSPEVLQAAAKTGIYIARSPVLMEGRIELLHYVINQSICDSYHRYGNLGERGLLMEQ